MDNCDDVKSALQSAVADLEWMSGSSDFSPGGTAYEGWVQVRTRLEQYRALLDTPPPDETEGT